MMDVRSLVPWARKTAPAARFDEEGNPFLALHREMDRMFGDFMQAFDLPAGRVTGWEQTWPQVEIADSGSEIKLTAELPGMEEKDIELTLNDGVLTLKGEKKSASETSQYSERFVGRFERSLPLGPDVDPGKVSASFKNGLLTVTIPKKPEAERTARRIPISE